MFRLSPTRPSLQQSPGDHYRQALFLSTRAAVVLLSVVSLSSCSRQTDKQTVVAAKPEAAGWASLAPSNTELIYALNAGDRLLAVCNQCDYPPNAKHKPQIGSFASVDLEQLARIKPNLVFLVDGQEGTANKIEQQASLHCLPVILHNKDIGDIARNLRIIGKYTGRQQSAQRLCAKFLAQIDAIKHITAGAQIKPVTPKVFFCVWPEPLVTAGSGSYLNEAITICGGTNIAGATARAYPQYSAEQLLLAQPDVIILPHEALTLPFINKSPWTSLKAVANKRVYYLPARDADRLSRPTLRILAGLYWLAQRLHPELTEKLEQQAAAGFSNHE